MNEAQFQDYVAGLIRRSNLRYSDICEEISATTGRSPHPPHISRALRGEYPTLLCDIAEALTGDRWERHVSTSYMKASRVVA